MKLIQYKIGLLSLATFVSASVMAQDLHKSIVIDKDIVPELKDVERINVTPQVPPLKVQTTKLNYDDLLYLFLSQWQMWIQWHCRNIADMLH